MVVALAVMAQWVLMGVAGLWSRSVLRRDRAAVLGLALVAGLGAAAVVVTVQGARRVEGTVERYQRAGHTYDLSVAACPPGVDAEAALQDAAVMIEQCLSPDAALAFALVVRADPAVERVNVVRPTVVGVRRVGEAQWSGTLSQDSLMAGEMPSARPILLSGRLPAEGAVDEIVLQENTAKETGWRVGDLIEVGSWTNDERDRAMTKSLPPTRTFGTVRVTGIVRGDEDFQAPDDVIIGPRILGGVVASTATARRWTADSTSYGTYVAVRLRDGASAAEMFVPFQKRADGWTVLFPDPFDGEDFSAALGPRLDAERRAALVIALILAAATIAFVGFTTLRQVRTDLADASTLEALGLGPRAIAGLGALRGLTLAVPVLVVASVVSFVTSRWTPFGLARRLEYRLGFRFDAVALVPTLVALGVAFAVSGAAGGAARRVLRRAGRRPLRDLAARAAGPVSMPATSFVRGAAARGGWLAVAFAVAGVVGGAGLAASADRLAREPARYGVWWDVAVGNYSTPDEANADAANLAKNPNLSLVAPDQNREVVVNGALATAGPWRPLIAAADLPMLEGRMPRSQGEIAISKALADIAHLNLGDAPNITSNDDQRGPLKEVPRRVVGIGLFAEATTGTDRVVFLSPDERPDSYPQSWLVKLRPDIDRAVALKSLEPTIVFQSSSIDRTDNLLRLRRLPWLLAAFIAALSLTAVMHSVVTILHRHRRDLGVLGTLGSTSRQLRLVAASTATWLALPALAIGLALGVLVGRLSWRAFARVLHVPSGPVVSWPAPILAVVGVLAVVNVVALAAAFRPSRARLADTLRSE